MFTRRRFLATATAAAAGLPHAGRAAAPGGIMVAYHDQSDELWRTTASGGTVGVASEILDEVVTRRAGYPVDYIGLPWLRAQAAVRDGQADALFTIATPARRQFMLFTAEPLVRYRLAIIYQADGPKTEALDRSATVADLKEFTYVYDQFDTTQTARAQQFAAAEAAPGDLPMMREVAGGRGDFTVGNLTRVRRMLDISGLAARLKVRPFPALGQVEHSFGLRETYPDAAGVIARIERASRAATAAGRIDAILAQHV